MPKKYSYKTIFFITNKKLTKLFFLPGQTVQRLVRQMARIAARKASRAAHRTGRGLWPARAARAIRRTGTIPADSLHRQRLRLPGRGVRRSGFGPERKQHLLSAAATATATVPPPPRRISHESRTHHRHSRSGHDRSGHRGGLGSP